MYVSVEGGLFHVNVYNEGACSPVYSTYIESLVPSSIPTFELLEGTKKIPKICKILVFDRNGFKAKAKKSIAFKSIKNRGLMYVEFKKVNISSSKIRNFWYD